MFILINSPASSRQNHVGPKPSLLSRIFSRLGHLRALPNLRRAISESKPHSPFKTSTCRKRIGAMPCAIRRKSASQRAASACARPGTWREQLSATAQLATSDLWGGWPAGCWVAGWLGGWVAGWLGGWVAGWLGGWVAGCPNQERRYPTTTMEADRRFGKRCFPFGEAPCSLPCCWREGKKVF